MAKANFKGHLALLAAYLIFGVNIVTTKDIANSEAIEPIALFSLRAIGASALFWLISLFTPKEKVPLKDLGLMALASFVGLFVPQFTFLQAITVSTPIDTSIVSTLGPIFTMFFAFFFVKEPITWKKFLGVLISFTGILFLILNSVHNENGVEATSPVGFMLLFLNAASFALYLGAFRPLIQRYNVVTFMKWMFLFSLLISLPFSCKALTEINFAALTPQVCCEIGFLVLFATFIAYFLIPFGQKSVRPTIVSMYSYVQPVVAVIISIFSGLDVITWKKGLAILMVFAGVAIVNKSRSASN